MFTVGHIRNGRRSEIFPIEGANGENRIQWLGSRKGYRLNTQVFDRQGITENLDTCGGGGREPHTVEIVKEAKYPSGNQKSDILGVGGCIKNALRHRLQTACEYRPACNNVREQHGNEPKSGIRYRQRRKPRRARWGGELHHSERGQGIVEQEDGRDADMPGDSR